MDHDIYALPEVEISEQEDRIFTAAEELLDCLQVCGCGLSREALIRHLERLGVTEAQMPALMDLAQRKRIIKPLPEEGRTGDVHIPVVGKLLLGRIEEYEIRLPATARAVLELRYGVRDGVPRSVEETARLLELTGEEIVTYEQRICQRLCWAERKRWRARRRHLGDFLQ